MAEKNPRLRAMLADLMAQKQAILDALAPYRKAHDEIVNDPRLVEARRAIKAANEVLGPIDQELAALARALGPKASLKAEPGVYSK